MRVTLLDASRQALGAFVADISRRGMSLWLPCRIPAGTPVQIEMAGALLLGDICYCVPDGDGYRAGIAVKHRVTIPADSAELTSARR